MVTRKARKAIAKIPIVCFHWSLWNACECGFPMSPMVQYHRDTSCLHFEQWLLSPESEKQNKVAKVAIVQNELFRSWRNKIIPLKSNLKSESMSEKVRKLVVLSLIRYSGVWLRSFWAQKPQKTDSFSLFKPFKSLFFARKRLFSSVFWLQGHSESDLFQLLSFQRYLESF